MFIFIITHTKRNLKSINPDLDARILVTYLVGQGTHVIIFNWLNIFKVVLTQLSKVTKYPLKDDIKKL